ncbi:MAG: DUF2271 domain-containing protein [Rikenellaceae bacterium]|nr:DUF2271 domain-containing protein [Rikenellaceae bacterium]
MKKHFFIALFTLIYCGVPFVYGSNSILDGKELEITYNVNRIPGPGSNQIAVWIEDAQENYVRSLYASRFTADGGYVRREVSLSEWIEKSDWANASKEEIDAVSGSTQTEGLATLVWDFKDKSGEWIKSGRYIICIEANIKNEKKMFYRGVVVVDKQTVDVKPGRITYSESEDDLEAGPQIFRDVEMKLKF